MSPPWPPGPRRSARLAISGSVWVVRHGQRIDQYDGDWWLTAERPHDPYCTTELGEQQATAAGEALVRASARVDVIYSSPFLRCVQTAARCAKLSVLARSASSQVSASSSWPTGLTMPQCVEASMPVDSGMSTKELVKRFGNLIDTTYTPLYDANERVAKAEQQSQHLITFPEDWHEGIARYQKTLAALSEASPFSLLVTHGAGVQACAEAIEGCPDMSDMDVDYCCLTNLVRQGAYKWKVTTLADASTPRTCPSRGNDALACAGAAPRGRRSGSTPQSSHLAICSAR